ncbi:SMC-Scp complex subunit ScpB [Agriterribacter sp.]|uniref:SMC-Scp complex subunit ScpB n=1 Tax=Agriterribacter sp. TaxID=2821509 RepID=UPI002CB1ED92|nr:SMC-Scp complex subunit ScpB [Agriterribacter sp.]HTN05856.1 SMC-Scp complex subunit ScpB [Agriterribacter sp.]
MEISQIILHIEALIFSSEKPLTSLELVELVNNALGFIEDRATLDQVEAAIEGIREKYATEFYPFEVRQSGGGWQFLTKGGFHKTIAQLNGDKFLKRLSAAAMEALAIIAYKQPITKGEVESIRGVNCDYVIQKLLEKELVVITGRNEALPGKPLIYATSRSFMDYFGINSAEDLPRIKEILADQVVEPTLVNARHFEVEAESNLVVAENGALLQHATLTIEGSGEPAIEEDELPATEEENRANEDAGLNDDDTLTNDEDTPGAGLPEDTPDTAASSREEDEDEERNDLQ